MSLTTFPHNAPYIVASSKAPERHASQPVVRREIERRQMKRHQNDNAPTPPLGAPDPSRLPNPSRASAPLAMREQDLAHHRLQAAQNGASGLEISARFNASRAVIRKARSLRRLHPKLLTAFMNKAMPLDLAAALSTIPNHQAQIDLLLQLGPFARQADIIKAIADGDTVLELPNGEILIMPSRALNLKSERRSDPSKAFNLSLAA